MDNLLGLGSSDEDEPEPSSKVASTVAEPSSTATAPPDGDDLGLGSDSDSEGEGAPMTSAASDTRAAATNGDEAAGGGGGSAADQSHGEERASNNYTFTIPNLPRPRPTANVHMTRLPNVLGFREEEFTPETFAESEDGRRFHRNLALWRYKRDDSGDVVRDADNNPIRESNSRLVKWSDGSMQLFVGNEPYEVAVRPADQGFLFVKQTPKESTTLLECQGEITSRVQFQPASLASDTHKKLTTKVRLENMKTSRIREVATVNDPERLKADRERAAMKRQRAEQSKGRGRSRASRPGMKSNYLEDDGRYDVVANVGDIKSKARESEYDSGDSFIASGSDEDADDFGSQQRSPGKAADSDSDSDGGQVAEEGDSDDSEEGAGMQRARKKQRAQGFESDDDE